MLHVATDSVPTSSMLASDAPDSTSSVSSNPFNQYKVIRRNGSAIIFEPAKISIALTRAFIAVNGGQGAASCHRILSKCSVRSAAAMPASMDWDALRARIRQNGMRNSKRRRRIFFETRVTEYQTGGALSYCIAIRPSHQKTVT